MYWWQKVVRFVGRVLLVVLVAGFTIVAFFPGVLTKYLQTYASRKYLAPLGLRVSYKGFEGDILGTLAFREITVKSVDGRFRLHLSNARLNVDFLRLLRRDLSLDKLFIEQMSLELPPIQAGVTRSIIDFSQMPWLSVQKLTILDGQITRGADQYELQLSGKFDLSDALVMEHLALKLVSPEREDTLHLAGERIAFDGQRLTVDSGEIGYRGSYVSLSGQVQVIPSIELDLQVASNQFKRPAALPDWLDYGTISGHVTGPPGALKCEISMQLVARGRTLDQAEFEFQLTPGGIRLDRSVFALGSQRVEATGDISFDGKAVLNASFAQARLSDFLPMFPALVLDGEATISSYLEKGEPRIATLTLSLDRLAFLDNEFHDVHGGVARNGSVWTITDTASLRFAGSDFQLWGSADEDMQMLDLEIYLQSEGLEELLSKLGWVPVGGAANGQVWINGPWDDPAVTGAIMLRGTHYQDFTIGQAFIQFILDHTRSHPRGRLFASMGDLDFMGLSAEGGEAEFIFAGDTLFAKTLRLYHGLDKLDTRGYLALSDPLKLVLDTVTVWHNTEMLTGGHSILQRAGARVELSPLALNVAAGVIDLSGAWADRDNFTLEATVDQIDMVRLQRFIGVPPRIRGSVNASASISHIDGQMTLSGSVHASEGELDQVPFTAMSSEFYLRDNRLSLRRLDWLHGDGGVAISGVLSYGRDRDHLMGIGALDSLALRVDLNRMPLEDLQSILPWRFETGGLVTGTITATGPAKAPIYDGDLVIANPRFDRLHGEHLAGQLHYSQQELTFSDLTFTTNVGAYMGGGTLPIDLRPTTGTLDIIRDAPVDMAFSGRSSRLEFITAFFQDDIDSLKGEFAIELALSGTFQRLIRNGRLEVQNGALQLFMMENPITGIQGEVVIENNLLRVVRLEGHTPRDRQRGRDNSRLAVAGTMELTRFFKPYFNLRIAGEDVYFARPFKEIEAVGSPAFSIVGRDSIYFRGEFTPNQNQIVLRLDLAPPENYALRKIDEGTIVIYDIHVPLYAGAIVDNTEINAEIEGEITLLKVGSEEFRFAGTIEVIDGSFVYNGYEFVFDEARVTLDPSVFNPQFYIRATTQVDAPGSDASGSGGRSDPELIDVTLVMTGTLEDHQFAFDYNSSAYTESDFLQLFALGKDPSGSVDPALTAGLSLKDILLRRIQEDARQASGLDRFRIQTMSPRTLIPSLQQVRIHIGKRLSPRLYVGLRADPTLSFNQYQIAYRLNRNLSVVGSVDQDGLYQGALRFKLRY